LGTNFQPGKNKKNLSQKIEETTTHHKVWRWNLLNARRFFSVPETNKKCVATEQDLQVPGI
jgi:hypothetical protein